MKIFKGMINETKKLDTKYGLIIKIYLIASLVVFSILLLALSGALFLKISGDLLFYRSIPVFYTHINDVAVLNKIVNRLTEDDIKFIVTPDGLLLVHDSETATRTKRLLIDENIVSANFGRRISFGRYMRNITDFERDFNLRRARHGMMRYYIRAIDGIQDVSLMIVYADESASNETTLSLLIRPEDDSDITRNQQIIGDIVEYLLDSIDCLKIENTIITDHEGRLLFVNSRVSVE